MSAGTLFGVSYGKGPNGLPLLSDVQKNFGKTTAGVYVPGSLPLVLCFFGQGTDAANLSGVFTDYPTAASAPGSNKTSICLCFKTTTTPGAGANGGLLAIDKSQMQAFFAAMATYVANNAGASVYWVYWQEPDGSSGVGGGAFTAAQYAAALTAIQGWANSEGCGVAGSASPNPFTQTMIKLEGQTALPAASPTFDQYLPATGLSILGFDSYGQESGVPGSHTGYPTPPWQSLGAVVTNILPAAKFTGYSGRSITDLVTNGTATITSATANFTAADVGAYVSAPGILSPRSLILTVSSATHAILSAPALTSASAQAARVGGLQWALGEFGSTGRPNACTAAACPCTDAGWTTTPGGSTGIPPAGSWYGAVANYLASITPQPVICNLFAKGGDGPAPGNNGSITCNSGTCVCTNHQPSWSYNPILMPSAPAPAQAYAAVIATGVPPITSVSGPAELGAYRIN